MLEQRRAGQRLCVRYSAGNDGEILFQRPSLIPAGLLVRTRQVVLRATLAAVAPGIAEALIATAIGLFAAIPAVLGYNRFSHDVDRIAIKLETFIEEFSNILQRSLGASGPSGSASGH